MCQHFFKNLSVIKPFDTGRYLSLTTLRVKRNGNQEDTGHILYQFPVPFIFIFAFTLFT